MLLNQNHRVGYGRVIALIFGAIMCLLAVVSASATVSSPILGNLADVAAVVVTEDRTCHDYAWLTESYTSAVDLAAGITVDETGLYVVGTTYSALPGQTHFGGADVFVRKYSLSGDLIWTRQFGSTSTDEGASIAADETGVYVTGSTRLNGMSNAFVRKYDSAGSELWTVQFDPSGNSYGRSIAVDQTGVYMLGDARYLLPGQSGLNTFYPHPFVRKFSKDGVEVWTRQFGTSLHDNGKHIALDETGIYVTGNTQGAFPGYTAAGNVDVFVRKYSKAGDAVWTHQFGSATQDIPHGISANGSRAYVVGQTNGALPGQTWTHSYDAFVIAYDASGGQLWLDQFSSPTTTTANGVLATASGALVGGGTKLSLNDEPNTGATDAFIRYYDAGGDPLWVDLFGSPGSEDPSYGPGTDYVNGFVTLGSRIFVLGFTSGVFHGQPLPGGGNDHFVAEIYADCGASPIVSAGGPYNAAEGESITLSTASASDDDGDHLTYSWTADSLLCSFSDATALTPDVTCQDNGAYTATLTVSDGINDPVGGETTITVANIAPIINSVANNSVANDGPINGGTSATIFVDATDPAGPNDPLTYEFDCDGDLAYEIGPAAANSASCYFSTPGTFTVNVRVREDDGEQALGSKTILVVPFQAMPGSVGWISQFSGWYHPFKNPTHAASVFAVDTEIYVAGGVYNYLPGQQTFGGTDAFVRKYGEDGTAIWTQQFGTSMNDSAAAVTADSSGVYVVGVVDRRALPNQTNLGEADAFIRKYSPSGSELWTRQFGTNKYDSAYSVAVDESGVFVVGSTQGSLATNDNDGVMDNDIFIRRYDKDGNEIWTRQFGTAKRPDGAFDVALGSNAIFVIGYTYDALPGQIYAGGVDADVFVRSYDLDGNELWTRQFGTALHEQLHGVAVDDSGVYVAGYSTAALPGQANSGSADPFIRKYAVDGNELWTRQFGGSAADYAFDIDVTERGVYVIGYTAGALPGQTSAGLSDIFIRKYSAAGNELWTEQLGTVDGDNPLGISISTSIYLVGSTNGTFPGQTNDGGGADAFVLRYDESVIAPITTASIAPEPDPFGIYPDPVTLSLSAQAGNGQNIVSTFYILDNGPEKIYSGPFQVSGAGQHTLQYWSVDNAGTVEAIKALTFTINGLKIVTGSLLPSGIVGLPFEAQLEAEGGTSPYTWSIVAGAPPPGLDLNAQTGLISGTPTAAGTFGFTVQVADSNKTVTKQFGMAQPPPTGEAGDNYIVPIVIVDPDPGSTLPPPACNNYEVVESELPDGLTLDPATGVINGTPTDGGSYTFTVQCVVEGGQTATKEFTITINNPLPTLTRLDPSSIRAETDGFELTLYGTNFVQSSMVYWNGNSRQTTHMSDTMLLAYINAADITAEGTAEVTVVNPEPVGGTSNPLIFTIEPPNLPPTADAGGSHTVEEGGTLSFDGSGSTDNEQDPATLTYEWDLDGDGEYDDATGTYPSLAVVALDGPQSLTIGLKVTDDFGESNTDTTTVEIRNAAPETGEITAPINPVMINALVETTVAFSDAGVLDTHTATWDWGDGSTSAGTINQADGSSMAYGSHTYEASGVYVIKITIEDNDGDIDEAIYQYVVIYNPSGGFVTGVGHIESPAGAYILDPTATGRAKFGFHTMYHKGATVPDGKTAFRFKANFEFKSTDYDWLVVAGSKAKFKGTGTIEDQVGLFKFMITAIDGDVKSNGSIDKFRIKIWSEDIDGTEHVVYDNQLGANYDVDPTTAVVNGSITVHR